METSKLRASCLAGVALLTSLAGPVANACPVCNTGTGQQVRAGIFDGHFGHNLLITVLPFLVFGAIIAAIHFGVAAPRESKPAPRVDGDHAEP